VKQSSKDVLGLSIFLITAAIILLDLMFNIIKFGGR